MLTAAEHQKISALQQIANLVGQAQSVSGNQAVLTNVVNNALSLIAPWERSDPEFQELAIWLRRARVDKSPHVIMNIAGQAQRMISLVRGGLGYKVNKEGERVIWDPIRGNVTSPMFEEGEPVRTFSPMGWRGSKKYPMGRAFPEWNLIEGTDYDFGNLEQNTADFTEGFLQGFDSFENFGDISIGGALIKLAFTGMTISNLYHGYKRNNGSVLWAFLWGFLGPIGIALSLAQGYGKPAKE